MRKDRIYEYDFLRVIGIGYIIGFLHIDNYFEKLSFQPNEFIMNLNYMTRDSFLGVLVCVSGLLLADKLDYLNSYKDAAWAFFRRLLRLYPLYLIVLVLYYIYYDFNVPPVSMWAHVFCVNLLLFPIVPESFRTIWFISLILTYQFLALISINISTVKRYWFFGLVWTGFVSGHYLFGFFDLRLLLFFPSFALGILGKWDFGNLKLFLLCLVIFPVTILFFMLDENWMKEQLLSVILVIGNILLLFVANKIMNASSLKFKRHISKLSYASLATFLFHRPFYRLLILMLVPKSDLETLFYLLLLGFPLIWAIGWGIQKIFDKVFYHPAIKFLSEKTGQLIISK